MTEAIKQWIADEAVVKYGYQPNEQDIFAAGLTKGIEIAEGFAEWLDDNYLQEEKGKWYSLGLKKDEIPEYFTTSQLLEKYLETLNKEKT